MDLGVLRKVCLDVGKLGFLLIIIDRDTALLPCFTALSNSRILTLPRLKPGGSDLRQLLLARVKGATPMGRRYLTVAAWIWL